MGIRDLITGERLSIVGTSTLARTPYGRSTQIATVNTDYYQSAANGPIVRRVQSGIGVEFTVVSIFRKTAGTAVRYGPIIQMRHDTNFQAPGLNWDTGGLAMFCDTAPTAGSDLETRAAFGLDDDVDYIAYGRKSSTIFNVGAYLAATGEFIGEDSGPEVIGPGGAASDAVAHSAANNELAIARNSESTSQGGAVGVHHLHLIYGRCLTRDELDLLASDPFGIIRPAQRFIIAAASGGSGLLRRLVAEGLFVGSRAA